MKFISWLGAGYWTPGAWTIDGVQFERRKDAIVVFVGDRWRPLTVDDALRLAS